MSNFADGLFPKYLTFLMLLPFLMMGFGLWFICRAFSDKGDARQSEPDPEARGRVVALPDRAQRPLYHVHQQIQASARPPPKAEPDEPERGPGGRRLPRRHRSNTRLELHQ
jgi:hypothetical protein